MSTKKIKHTPTPWRAPFLYYDDEISISITDEEQMFGICELNIVYNENKEVMRANAELIVRAVNCHDELIEALSDLLGDAEILTDKHEKYAYLLKRARGE